MWSRSSLWEAREKIFLLDHCRHGERIPFFGIIQTDLPEPGEAVSEGEGKEERPKRQKTSDQWSCLLLEELLHL